jgi:multiple sugar transport system permease protein
MFEDPKIGLSLGNTFIFVVLSVPLHILVSLALALLLLRAARATGFFRTVFFLPKMTPAVAVGVLFLLIFNGQNGLINRVLGFFGIQGPYWTTDPFWVKPGLVLISLWTIGSSIVILLAALKNVPVELYESARIDGANFWQQTMRITVPMISSTIFFLAIINTIYGFQIFTEAYTAFFGSGNTTYSNDAALFYVIYLFRQGFEFLHMGYASAMAWLLFVVIMVFTVAQFALSRRVVYYEGDNR